MALPFLFEFWAHEHQLPPEGDWRTWVVLGGRGAGKTRAGAEWVRAQVEGAKPLDKGRCRRLALIGETYDQAREVMIYGDSGILACTPHDRKPKFISGRRLLVWPNGAEAMLFSAQDPEALRGPQFDGAWVDEFAKWKKAKDVWDMLQFGLRLGEAPRVCVTTTPRNVEALKTLLEMPSTVKTHAATDENRAFLAKSFLEEMRAEYADSSLGRQELDGLLVDQVEGAFWTREMFDAGRSGRVPDLDRIVVAVDPPAKSGPTSDACGIMVAGVVEAEDPRDRRAYVLEDATVKGVGPSGWAEAAIAALHRWQADRIVAEVNQGGDMVETTLRQIDPLVPYKAVNATRGKSARAEPVAALYEQGRVYHGRGLDALENQMCLMTPRDYKGSGSPDRVDALVWALTELMLERPAPKAVPRMRLV